MARCQYEYSITTWTLTDPLAKLLDHLNVLGEECWVVYHHHEVMLFDNQPSMLVFARREKLDEIPVSP